MGGILGSPRAPRPSPPPDPRVAQDNELKKIAAADLVRERFLREQNREDRKFTGAQVRKGGLKL